MSPDGSLPLGGSGAGIGTPGARAGGISIGDFVEVVADGGSSASSDKPTSLSSSRSLLTPRGWSLPAMFMLLMLLSPKNTSKNAYESFLPMDSMLFTCARFPILFKFPLTSKVDCTHARDALNTSHCSQIVVER